MVSARACANQFLPCSSSGIALFGMRTVQADSCLSSEQIDTLFISVGGQEGVLGGGWDFGLEAQNLHVYVRTFFFTPPVWPVPHITMSVQCTYGVFSRELDIHTVIYIGLARTIQWNPCTHI